MSKQQETQTVSKTASKIKKEKEYPLTYSPLSHLSYNLNFFFKDPYPAKMPEEFARDMINLYSKPGMTVWDGCCGAGTVAEKANFMKRIGIGTDVNPKAIEICKKNDPNFEKNYYVLDARKMDFGKTKADLILSSLPFGTNIIGDKNSYSELDDDISHSSRYLEYLNGAEGILLSYFRNLKHGGVCVIDARDRLEDGKTFPLIFDLYHIAMKIGFKLICRFDYELIPYRQMTYKWKPIKNMKGIHVKSMPSSVDVIVLCKWEDGKIK